MRVFPVSGPGLVAAVLLGGLLVLPGIVPTRPAGAQEPAPPSLRVLSLNLLHGGVLSGLTGDDQGLERRLELVAEALDALQPDIVGLQEASTGRQRGNVAERLARRLGYQHVYAPALLRVFPFGWLNRFAHWVMNFTEGPAILSRFPILRSERHELPRCGRWIDPRMLVHAEVLAPGGPLAVFSAHTSGDPCQTSRVAELVRERAGPRPALLMGDFNAVEDSPAIAVLTREAGFTDAFRVANPGLPGATVWQQVRAAAPTARRRVDYVFLVPGSEVPGHVIESRVVLDTPRRHPDGTVLWPSDHYGVIAELALGPGAAMVGAAAAADHRPAR